jgi:iron complex outermembrane receptor protein
MRNTDRHPGFQLPWNRMLVAMTTTVLALALIPATALAQDNEGEEEASGLMLEEVIVTARKREESLMDVPVAVTAFDEQFLNEVDVGDITYVSRLSPNTTLSQSRATSSTLTAFIRGVGQQDPLVGFEPGVGIYLDDVYIARPQGSIFQVYDVQSIEVLRGPQGTLYGRNTIGGALKYITKRMPDHPEGKVELAVGLDGYGQLDGIATGSHPLSETVRIGGSIASFNRDGYGMNLFTGEDHYDQEVLAGRISLEWLPTESFFLRLAADYTDDDSGPKGGHRLTVGNLHRAPVLDNVFDHRSGAAVLPSTAGINGNNETETKGVSLLMEWYLNERVTFKSITAYREGYTENVIDFDSLPEMDFDAPVIYEDDQTSQEFQFIYSGDRWQGVVGLHWLDAWASNDFDVVLGQLHPLGITAYSFAVTDTEAWAVFGDLSYDISEHWALSIGGRYTDDERSATILRQTYLGFGSTPFGNENAILLATTSSYTGNRNDTEFTPKASITWRPNEDHNVYLSYSEGFKAGSFDPRGSSFTNPNVVYGFAPEFVDSWEAGVKSSWAGGRATTTVAVFTNDYTDQQIPGSVLVDTDGDGVNDEFVGAVTNAGKSEMDGFEFEGSFLVAESLTLRGMVGYIDANFIEFIVNGENQADERVFQNTPEWTGAVSFDLRSDLNFGSWDGEVGVIGTWSYRDSIHMFEYVSPIDQGSYSLIDLSLIWASRDGRYLFGLHGKNLGDEEYRVAGYDFPTLGLEGSVTGFYGPPRTITATAQFMFN